MLNKITRTIYPASDDHILEYLDDDGLIVEPLFYAPIIPMVLVNGSKGIGTGFSTDIMCYNPLEIIAYIREKLAGVTNEQKHGFIPYYEGFKGTITKIDDAKLLIKGRYEKMGTDKIRVTELPVGYWTEDFKELLEKLIEPEVGKDGKKMVSLIKDYDDMSKDTNVDFTIIFAKGKLEALELTKGDYGCNGLEKLLKLYTTNTNTNMHLFNANDKLHKYETVEDIINDYYITRLKMYQTRKDYMISALQKELLLLSNKAKYIMEILNDTIDLRKKKKETIFKMLSDKGYAVIEEDTEYKYLVKMPMDSVTEENVDKLNREHSTKKMELDIVTSTTVNQMWSNELDKLSQDYLEYKEERERLMSGIDIKSKKKVVSKGLVSKKNVKNIVVIEE